MGQSVLERVALERLAICRQALLAHDRAVIVGLLLSLFPIVPAAPLGLLVSYVNRRLLIKGRLAVHEASFIKASIWLGAVNTVLGTGLLLLLASLVADADLSHTFVELKHVFSFIKSLLPLPSGVGGKTLSI